MTYVAYSKPRPVLAAVSLFVLLSAAAFGNDLEPLEDVTKLEKPTISYTADGGVYLIDWDGQNNRLWLKGEYGLPIWSMDGRYVSVAGGVPGKFYGKYVLNFRTGEEANITRRIIQTMGINFWREFEILASQWMPGGGRMACVVGEFFLPPHGPHRELYMLTISTGKMVNITKTAGKSESQITVSPDGKIAFSTNVKEPFNLINKRDIFIMNADGTDLRNITNTPNSSEQSPVWSPDGKKIALLGFGGLSIMNPDGSNIELITPVKGWVELTTWSPDSKWILYGMNPDFERFGFQSGFRIFRVNVDTKEIVRVTPEGVNTRFGSWVLAGKSRFLSVDPADKKKAQWGTLKAEEPTAPQKTTADAE